MGDNWLPIFLYRKISGLSGPKIINLANGALFTSTIMNPANVTLIIDMYKHLLQSYDFEWVLDSLEVIQTEYDNNLNQHMVASLSK